MPVHDDHQALNTKLQAPNNRVLANERNLIGALGDGRLALELPLSLERDGFKYVEAEGFLSWLSQYIALTEAEIPFPDELMAQVKKSKAEAAASQLQASDQEIKSLTQALEDCFENNLDELPEPLRKRVEEEFFPHLWDPLSPQQRKYGALQLDYLNDPATQQDRTYWWKFFVRRDELKNQITEWEAAETPTASDLAVKETRLKELRQELELMEVLQRQGRGDYYPERKGMDHNSASPPAAGFIAYPKAMKILREKWQATWQELAVWVFLGPESDGIAAYVNANELPDPPLFGFAYYTGCDDYLSPLMSCWFRQEDIEHFKPADRYITGAALIDRWSMYPDLHPRAFINAKIAESRLIDLHPTFGSTRGTFDEQENFPPLEAGLFAISHIERIEAEDLDDTPGSSSPPVEPDKDVSHKQGGRPKEPLAEAVEKAYLYFLDKGDVAILQPGNIKSFLKEFRSLAIDGANPGGFGNWNVHEYLAERIKEVKIPHAGECSVVTHKRQEGRKTLPGQRCTQKHIAKILTRLRKRNPFPS